MRYFKHSNYTSFTRQLNYYNFKKVDQQSIPHHRNQNVTFSHPYFQRCHPEDMKNIMRKHQSPISPRRMSPTTIVDLQNPRFIIQDSIQQHHEIDHSQNNHHHHMHEECHEQQQQQQQLQQSHHHQQQQQPQGPTYLRSRAHDIGFSNFINSELYYAPLSPPPEYPFSDSPVTAPLQFVQSYEMSDSSEDTLFSPDDLDFLLDEDSPDSNQ